MGVASENLGSCEVELESASMEEDTQKEAIFGLSDEGEFINSHKKKLSRVLV